MTDRVPIDLEIGINRQVLDWLDRKSAHSDIADALRAAVKPLGDARLFCPDWGAYRYVIAFTKRTIFALAVEMQAIGFRLDERMKDRALASGGAPYPEWGESWVRFTLFRDDWPKVDLEFWARKAYVAARDVTMESR